MSACFAFMYPEDNHNWRWSCKAASLPGCLSVLYCNVLEGGSYISLRLVADAVIQCGISLGDKSSWNNEFRSPLVLSI